MGPDDTLEMFIFLLRRRAATSHCSDVHTETSENRFLAMPRDTRKRLNITRRFISCLLAGRFRLSADFSLVNSDRRGARLVQSGHECFGNDLIFSYISGCINSSFVMIVVMYALFFHKKYLF